MKCEYNCGKEAYYQLKNGKWCCSKHPNSCDGKKSKHDQRGDKNPMFGKKPWNKGLNITDKRVKKYTDNAKQTIQEQFENGRDVWNKGLNKDTDERVKINAERMAISKKGKPNYKLRKPIEQCKSKCRSHFRNLFKKGLYTDWIFPILKRDDFKCKMCGNKKSLEVHHKKPFREIFDECVDFVGLNFENWVAWTKKEIENLHKQILISHKMEDGITVCKKCHGKIDPYRKQLLEEEL